MSNVVKFTPAPHYHQTIPGSKNIDTCNKCGLDIRNPVHYRLNDERLVKS